jgi:hypothetical protein
VLLETVTVNAVDSAAVFSTNTLTAGYFYRLEVAGFQQWFFPTVPLAQADAEFSTTDGFVTTADGNSDLLVVYSAVIGGPPVASTVTNAQDVLWGTTFNPSHEYSFDVIGNGSTIGFVVDDNFYGDNLGTLTVDIVQIAVEVCETLPPISQGVVTTSNSGNFPSTASYSCDPGYELLGSPTRTCNPDGSWDGTAPTCAGLACDALASPANGTVSTSNGGTYPSTASYTCDAGYALEGSPTRSCTPDGSWDGTAPTCLALAIVDDFSDGLADGWTEVDNEGVTETYTVIGQAYRLEAAANGTPGNPPRAGANRLGAGEVYSDFAMAVDVVDFDATAGNVFGLFARQNNIGFATTDGYVLGYNVSTTNFFIDRIENEQPVSPLALVAVGLNSSSDYRFVFEGSGTALTGTLYELPDLAEPIAQISGNDGTYTSGHPGLFVFDFSGGSSGAGATFDNVAFGDPAVDPDGDGLFDGFEIAYGLNPVVGGQQVDDPDLDGLDNLAEQAAGTNPNNADSDGDGFDDGMEVASGTDPLDELNFPVAVPLLGPWSLSLLAVLLGMAGAVRLREPHVSRCS